MPMFRIHGIGAGQFQRPQTIMIRPGAGGGIDQKKVVIAVQCRRSFLNGHPPFFPFAVWFGDPDAVSGERDRVLHPGNIQFLGAVFAAFPTGPDKIMLIPMFQYGAVDCPMIVRRGNFADEF